MSIGSLSIFGRARAIRQAGVARITIAFYESDAVEVAAEEEKSSREPKADDRSSAVNMTRPGKEVPDHQLLQRFQQGDEDGYVELYLRRQAEVYTYCLRLSQGDQDLASDVFQETFLKVYRKAHTFREGTNVLGWLYTIVRTTFLNHKRQRRSTSLDESHSQTIASHDRALQPDFPAEQAMLKERVERAIAKLQPELREPFLLREFDGFSYQEISDQLSITLGAVRQRIYRAKQAMREDLWDLIADDPSISIERDKA